MTPLRRPRAALTLLEMMVSVTLLAIIMIGLLAMFSHTQKALHIAATQTDVFENARGAIQLLGRDLSELTAYDDPLVTSASFLLVDNPTGPLTLPGGSGGTTISQPLAFEEAVWLTKVNDDWQATGYYVEGTNNGVGTLYRYSETTDRVRAPGLINRFYTDPNLPANRVSDGIVHFQLTPVYPFTNLTSTGFVSSSTFTFSNVLPAFVDIELGVLEPATLKQFQSIADLNLANAQRFLTNQLGRIHFFRERVPVRNFINPYRDHEVP